MQLSAKQFYANVTVDDEQTDTDAHMDDSEAADGAMTPSIEVSQWVNEHGGLDSVKKLVNEERRMRLYLRDIAKAVGVAENDQIWIDAILEALGKRLMPEGYEWPRYESGEPVRIGDKFECWCGEEHVVGSVSFKGSCAVLNMSHAHTFVVGHGPETVHGKRVKRPAPKVLDADGVEIRVGDTVWHKQTGRSAIVKGFDRMLDEPCAVIDFAGIEQRVSGALLTHEPPDTWERLEEDAKMRPRDYCGMILNWCIDPNVDTTRYIDGMKSDLVRRAKLLYLGRINESMA